VTKSQKITKVALTVVMLLFASTMVMPLIWMISTSFKMESEVFNFPLTLIPRKWNIIANYSEVWGSTYNFGLYYLNSIKVTVITTICQVFISALGAYGFSKINFKGRDKIFFLYLATMMIPDQVTIVPRFVILQKIGLYNTHLGLIVLGSLSVYGVFLLRQNLVMIPQSLSESGRIDGAGHFRIFWQIMLPIIKPGIATLAILKFVWTWNDYQSPLVFLSKPSLYTIQLGMRVFASEAGLYFSLVMAAAVSAIIPLVIVFLIGQRWVIEGIAAGAVKG
jgi:multiple sugar transport system permease protein